MSQNPEDLPPDGRRPGRQRRPGRGLPAADALADLARTYLQAQRPLWPELVAAGVLPEPDEAVLASMFGSFRRQFLAGPIPGYRPPLASPPWSALAASYLRYSDANSNPRSLDQQLKLQLERARREGHFIPWAYVFADAAVSGTTADRRGYVLAKQALGLAELSVLSIDEVGRASRDAIESLRLGRLVDRSGKRLIGVSDGFDSRAPTSKMTLSMYGMVQEWFVDQLRSKVNRGMNDAFDRGTNVHPPALGYRLVPAVDARGRLRTGQDGAPLMAQGVDDPGAAHVLEGFRLYGLQGQSLGSIARLFNERSVGGSRKWTSSAIGKMLRRTTYAGIEIDRQTYQVRDPDTGRVTTRQRPRKEWRVRRVPHLRIVPWRLWKVVKKRLEACGAAYARDRGADSPTRSEVYPRLLIRPICGSCGAELGLGRSGRHASFCCHNGRVGQRGCQFKGYKSVRIVERAILGELRARVFTAEFLGGVIEAANRHLAEESSRPREDPGPLEAEIRSVRGKRDRLVALLDREGEGDLGAVVAQVRAHERRLQELRGRREGQEARDRVPPPPIEPAEIGALLDDLRSVLERDVAVAAPLLRELTGPVVVDQVAGAAGSRPTWVARFTVRAVPLLARLTAARRCPGSDTWESLKRRRRRVMIG